MTYQGLICLQYFWHPSSFEIHLHITFDYTQPASLTMFHLHSAVIRFPWWETVCFVTGVTRFYHFFSLFLACFTRSLDSLFEELGKVNRLQFSFLPVLVTHCPSHSACCVLLSWRVNSLDMLTHPFLSLSHCCN